MKAAYFAGITEGLQGDLSGCLKSYIPASNSTDALWHAVDFVWSTVQLTGYSSADLEHLVWVHTINGLIPTTPDIQCSVRTLLCVAPYLKTCVWLVLLQSQGAIQLWLH